jgi:Leucine-rich repeat (LRR) protein
MRYLFILALFYVQHVFASGGVYTSLNEALANPSSAKTLLLNGKNLSQVPKSIGALTELEYLDLSNNQLKVFPKEILGLSKLKGLNLKGNQISVIDSDIAQLKNLEALYISQSLNNNWQETKVVEKSLPPQLFDLCALKTLEIGNFGLTAIPSEILHSNIEELYLFNNLMRELPAETFAIGTLKVLDVSNNQLRQLPENIGYSSRLKILNVNGNKITRLPDAIALLKGLTYLHLAANAFQQPDVEVKKVFQCSSLLYLNLSALKITAADASIGNLNRLEELDLSYNKLTVLPETIGQFSRLLRLNLARNNLKDMPESMREMTSLNIIDLSYNDFLSFPKAITTLSELKTMDISFNKKMTAFPPEVEHMSGLKIINLSKTGFTAAQQIKFRDSLISCNFIL